MVSKLGEHWAKVGAFLIIVVLVGCASGPPALRINGSIEASPELNPDSRGRASPVVVRVYRLRSPGSFQRADFFALYHNEMSSIGQSLISLDEFEIQPGEKRDYNMEVDVETKYLGVIAAFRDLGNARWRDLIKLSGEKKVSVTINLESLGVSMAMD